MLKYDMEKVVNGPKVQILLCFTWCQFVCFLMYQDTQKENLSFKYFKGLSEVEAALIGLNYLSKKKTQSKTMNWFALTVYY